MPRAGQGREGGWPPPPLLPAEANLVYFSS